VSGTGLAPVRSGGPPSGTDNRAVPTKEAWRSRGTTPSIACFGLAKTETPKDKPAAADEEPPTDRKPSRMDEILKVIEEYANSQSELLRTLRKKFFH
jgi:hypothetical protein